MLSPGQDALGHATYERSRDNRRPLEFIAHGQADGAWFVNG
jgi:hypothetical protein